MQMENNSRTASSSRRKNLDDPGQNSKIKTAVPKMLEIRLLVVVNTV